MRVLAFNGSPRGRRSNTDRILQPFLEGAREAGAETETVYLRELEIRPCLGCFTCWTKTPGVCVHQDDMPPLLEKMRHADVTVYATPLYVFTVSGIMKNLMDRHIPNLDPHILKRGEHYIHPPRHEDTPRRRMVLISNCGFPERHHFHGLVETFRQMSQGPDSELSATILCAAGELLRQPALQDSLGWYRQAARQAGREVIELGRISPETQAVLDPELIDPAVFSQMVNAHWDSLIAAPQAQTQTQAGETKGGRPLAPPAAQPTTLREIIAGMPLAFHASATGDLQAVIQFDVTGDEPGQYHLRIAGGTCRAYEGTHPAPTLTIHTPSDVWLRVIHGELDGAAGMVQGLYAIEGDMGLLTGMGRLFGDPAPDPGPDPSAPDAGQADGVRQIIEGMALAFNPARAGDRRAVLQFRVTGGDPVDCYLRIADGTCTYHQGIAQDATTTITTPADVWASVARGEMDGAEALMQGLYTVSGDFTLMTELDSLFSGADAGPPPATRPGGPIAISGMAWMSVAFVPWIVHWVLGGLDLGGLWSIGLPPALSAAVWLYRRRYIETTWLDTGSVLFFAAAGALALLDPSFWATYGGVVGSLVMAGAWMGTLATDTPLTAGYSRWSYPPELANNPLFIRTNAAITAFWGAVFLAQAGISLLAVAHPAQRLLWTVVRYLTLVPGLWFTAWFQRWYPAHVAAGAQSQAAT